jgi:hypothetical protein
VIYEAQTHSIVRPEGQDANTFRLQLEALADAILKGAPLVNANLEDGIAAVKAMVAVGHSAHHGGDWVNLEEVEGDLAHSYFEVAATSGRLGGSAQRTPGISLCPDTYRSGI